jgi:hypothetical protein
VTPFQPRNDHKSIGKKQISFTGGGLKSGHDTEGHAPLNSTPRAYSPFTCADAAEKQPVDAETVAAKAALIIGHPGHELCVYGWCALARPSVFILTDGSGRTEASRTARSVEILHRIGCNIEPGTGLLTDREVYQSLLTRDHKLFTQLARRLAEWLVRDDIDSVVGDAGEGFNPVHDACRLIINSAVGMAARARTHPISNFAFRLDWRKERECSREPDGARTLTLDQPTFDRKLSAAWAYDELRSDIEVVLSDNGVDSFRTERFDPIMIDEMADGMARHDHRHSSSPYYEDYGARLMRQGIYDQVIRYREHLAPLADALNLTAQEGL